MSRCCVNRVVVKQGTTLCYWHLAHTIWDGSDSGPLIPRGSHPWALPQRTTTRRNTSHPMKAGDRMASRCAARAKSTGTQCKRQAIEGGTVCYRHGGAAPQVRARAHVAAELSHWRVGDATADPIETLLGLLTQSRWRADLYASLLEQAYEAADRLRRHDAAAERLIVPEGQTDGTDNDGQEHTHVARAREDLANIFTTGGVAALIGNTYAATKDGDVFATGEAIRGLARLEAEERDRCARFAKLAIEAGVAERQVKVAERQAEMVGTLLAAALTDAGLGDRAQEVLGHVGRRLRLVAGGSARPA